MQDRHEAKYSLCQNFGADGDHDDSGRAAEQQHCYLWSSPRLHWMRRHVPLNFVLNHVGFFNMPWHHTVQWLLHSSSIEIPPRSDHTHCYKAPLFFGGRVDVKLCMLGFNPETSGSAAKWSSQVTRKKNCIRYNIRSAQWWCGEGRTHYATNEKEMPSWLLKDCTLPVKFIFNVLLLYGSSAQNKTLCFATDHYNTDPVWNLWALCVHNNAT